MARLQRLEIGHGRLINMCRAGCPILPPSSKARSRACRRGRALATEAGVTGWKIADCHADWRTGPVHGVRAGPCRSHACSGRLPLLARLTCAALFVPPDAVSCRLPQLASQCPAGERLPKAALLEEERHRHPTTRHSCVHAALALAATLAPAAPAPSDSTGHRKPTMNNSAPQPANPDDASRS